MMNFTFKGLMAPVFTIFNSDMTVNVADIPKYAKYLLDSGIKGVLVHGTTGEGTSLNVQERKLITEAWTKAVKSTKQHLMIQVGGAPLPDVLELAKHAESLNVDSLLCLPELYFSPTTPTELINYLNLVGASAPKTPLLYYHIPMFTNVTINMAQFLTEAVGKIPTFQGIKFTSTNLVEGMEAVKANNGKYSVFLGADQLIAGAFTLGFDSVIATSLNMVPKLSNDILQASNDSDLKKAQKIQETLTAVCGVITKHGGWVPTMKAAMNIIAPINVGQVRAPLENITNDQINQMKADLKVYLD